MLPFIPTGFNPHSTSLEYSVSTAAIARDIDFRNENNRPALGGVADLLHSLDRSQMYQKRCVSHVEASSVDSRSECGNQQECPPGIAFMIIWGISSVSESNLPAPLSFFWTPFTHSIYPSPELFHFWNIDNASSVENPFRIIHAIHNACPL